MYTKDLSQTKYGINQSLQTAQSWIEPNNPDYFYRGGTRFLNHWIQLQRQRREEHSAQMDRITPEVLDIVKTIEEQGYYKIENFWDTELLDEVKNQTIEMMRSADPKKVNYPQNGVHTKIIHPLKNIPITNKMATHPKIQAIAAAFLGAPAGLGTTNLRMSTADKSKNVGTNMFHKDFNSPIRLIKFFTYFNDVTKENGPFTYVKNSNRMMPSDPPWWSIHRWPDDKIESIYGKDRIINLTANYGDLIVATTNGFHKGLKLESGERLMLTLNYLIHPECGDRGFDAPPEAIHPVLKDTFDDLAPEDKYLYDFMERV
tara:strand:+ start:15225 stop:16172 length:948 start_codon:yes stop_codon:yes gene_type:complete